MVNYQNGKIYKIEDLGGNMCYIGSTTKMVFSYRMSEHRTKYRYWLLDNTTTKYSVFDIFEAYGIENCRIVLVELCPCDTKDELIKSEAHYIRTVNCVNKNIPTRTQKQYYEENKEAILNNVKAYSQEHKDEKHEYDKQYLNKNKEIMYAKKAAVVACLCGKTYTRSNKSSHIKATHHIDYIANIPLNV